ncbi:MAG: PepSY domain-containing protein [Lachnospiraceae bacterium]|nr:PepSY domain-containing protein [Lachnospiraceae bacterium]
MRKRMITAAVCTALMALLISGHAFAVTFAGVETIHGAPGSTSGQTLTGTKETKKTGLDGWNQGNPKTPEKAGGSVDAYTAELSREEALSIALKHAGLKESEVEFAKAELDYDDRVLLYDIEFYQGEFKYDYDVDAKTGRIWAAGWKIMDQYRGYEGTGSGSPKAYSAPSNAQAGAPAADTGKAEKPQAETVPKASSNTAKTEGITEQEALSIALKAAGVKESEISRQRTWLDYEHGRRVYEVRFNVGWTEYEYDIDVNTGEIVKVDIDIDD